MEKKNRIAQLYGYAVCLIAVITFLISVSALVRASFDLSDPLHAGGTRFTGKSLASFDNYKLDVLKASRPSTNAGEPGYVPDDKTIAGMFEAAKADRIQSVRLEAHRSITVSLLLIAVCIALFGFHWRWLRGLPTPE